MPIRGDPPVSKYCDSATDGSTYLLAEMRSFAADVRTNNEDMPKFMQALTDSEIDAMALSIRAVNTIGMVRVACCTWAMTRLVEARMTSGASALFPPPGCE